jgi:uncharacterized membrane protein
MSVEEDYKKTPKELYDSLPKRTQTWVDNKVSKIKVTFALWFIFTVVAVSAVIIFVIRNPFEEPLGLWLQRSGSIISLLAVIAEVVFVAKLNKLVRISHWAKLTCEVYLDIKYKPLLNISIFITIVLVILGTLIWGYGDILYEQINASSEASKIST